MVTQSSKDSTQLKLLYGQILFDADAIKKRIAELAEDLVHKYKGQNPLFVCLLRGGAPFSAQLMFAITEYDPHFHPVLDYMTIRTYGDSRTARKPEIILNLSPHTNIQGRPVVILDDVYDTGETILFTAKTLISQGASNISAYVLVKRQNMHIPFPGLLVYGFNAPSGWLTGMGLDDTRIAPEANRWAEYIALANDADTL